MKKICAVSGQEFEVTEKDLQFYEKTGVPVPTFCPEERFRRRLNFRNGGILYQTKCGLTGKPIICMYPPDHKFPVYEQTAWWSDAWSALDYGREYDFSRPFFDQLQDLISVVPHISLLNTNVENSYYTNYALNLKNGYLITGAADDEDSMYGYFIISCKDMVDGESVNECELCYDGIASFNCYHCLHFIHCRHCSDCILTEDCTSCRDCIACFGLQQKQYYILNQYVGKEEFERRKKELKLSCAGGLDELRQQFDQMRKSLPHMASHIYTSENCTGDMLFYCKNCEWCFDCRNNENCKYVAFAPNSLESYDCNFCAPVGAQFCYEGIGVLGHNLRCNAMVWYSDEVDYSMECYHSRNLFGCVGMRRAEYCILNKQYEKKEYFALRDRIIAHMKETGEWGEYFPSRLSPIPYNASTAYFYYPLKKEEALARGCTWYDDPSTPELRRTGEHTVPSCITDVPDDILNQTLVCEATGKPYKIQKAELEFYRKVEVPIPTLCPMERNRRRTRRRNPKKLYSRPCDKCGANIQTTYAPDRPEKVYCEKCYLETVE